ncbi:MAG: sugar phosphate isomerase/epimerase family protein [Huintestinicola sp.]
MKLHIIPDRNQIEKSLALAEKYGAAFEYNDFFIPDVMDDTVLTKEIIDKYHEYDLPENSSFHGAFFDVTIFSSDRRIKDISDFRVNLSIDIARRMNCRKIVFHTNYLPTFLSESYRREWVERNTEYWSEKLVQFPDMTIYIENMFDTDPVLLGKLAENMKHEERFGVCFDYAHAAVSPTPLWVWTDTLAPYTKHMHINDNDLISDLHLPVGSGKINWEEFVKDYAKLPLTPSVLIEVSSPEKQEKSLEYLFGNESFAKLYERTEKQPLSE